MSDAPAPTGRSPENPPKTEPIPIPEAEARARKARTVRIQDILAAHARALDVRLEEGMRDIRLAMEAAIRRSAIHEAAMPAAPPVQVAPPPVVQQPAAPTPPPPPREDVARGLAQQTEERFQALTVRLQRIEDSIRGMSLGGSSAGELENRLDAVADGIDRLAEAEDRIVERFAEAQREALDDLTRRVGVGVAAVIRALQNELNATVRRLELTADTSSSVAADEASRLERTMMAIAEHHESVLDDRLAELRDQISRFRPENGQTASPAEASS